MTGEPPCKHEKLNVGCGFALSIYINIIYMYDKNGLQLGPLVKYQSCTFFMHKKGYYENNKETSTVMGQPSIFRGGGMAEMVKSISGCPRGSKFKTRRQIIFEKGVGFKKLLCCLLIWDLLV
jgi:hypothetical protein